MNKYIIDLINQKQSLYRLIYIFSPMKLEILKTYIKTCLKSGFIQISKFLPNPPIPFDQKLESSFDLYIMIEILII